MKKTFLILALLSVSLLPLTSLAQVGLPATELPGASSAAGITDMTSLLSWANKLINWFFVIVLVLAVIAFVYAGFQYVLSFGGGDTKAAKDIIIYTVIGVIIAVLAKSFVWFAYGIATGNLG